MKNLIPFFVLVLFYSCSDNKPCVEFCDCGVNLNIEEESIENALAKSSAKQMTDTAELQESIAKIEEKYGEQWDFCDCVVKGDSINKAFSKPNLPDKEFDRLSARFDEIDSRCQAFRIQDASRTPEQRELHEKKVRNCLRDAGKLKN